MHLVELFLPLNDNEGKPLPHSIFDQVRSELMQEFEGLTAYSRAPADGMWKAPDEGTAHDHIVIYEVMVPHLDRSWWAQFREKLEGLFRQHTLLIRASQIETL